MANPKYPKNYDDELTTTPPFLPGISESADIADYVTRLKQSIIVVERELGINPSGAQATVSERLDLIESGSGEAQSYGESIHRVQIADKYSLNDIYNRFLVVGQISLNGLEETNLSTSPTSEVEVTLKVHVYVQKNTILTTRLYDITNGYATLIKQFTFNNDTGYVGGHFTKEVQLNIVTDIPLSSRIYEFRIYQEATGAVTSNEKSIVWDASLLLKSTNTPSSDGYTTARYTPITTDDLIVWKFDENNISGFTTFVNDGYAGSDGNLYNAINPHTPGYAGIYSNGAYLDGYDMETVGAVVEPTIMTVSSWLCPIDAVTAEDIGIQKLDANGNYVFKMLIDASNYFAFEYYGTDGMYHTYTTNFRVDASLAWIFVGFVISLPSVSICINGNFVTLNTGATSGIDFDGPLATGPGNWTVINSNYIIDDTRIAQTARSATWFMDTYKLGINRYP